MTEKEKEIQDKRSGSIFQTGLSGFTFRWGFSPFSVMLKYIHRSLLQDIYSHAGTFRNYIISKDEPILNGISVKYANYQMIEETLSYDFLCERKEQNMHLFGYKVDIGEGCRIYIFYLQVHPFLLRGKYQDNSCFYECYLKPEDLCR